MRCRILNIGPDSGIHGLLRERLEAERLISLQHIETDSLALEIMCQLTRSELPHIVLIPFQLPDRKILDIIARMRSHEHLQYVRIFVWGSSIPSHRIDWMYEAGAACILPGQFTIEHLDAMRVFCHICTEADRREKHPRQAITPALLMSGEKKIRNAKLGTLFFWTGCLSAVLWGCSVPQLDATQTIAELTSFSIYVALACAGIVLMWCMGNQNRMWRA